mmetsp:Transcript_34482/g.89313  ORF Transcript_34482/g.89313 Transcript_34482/m.89313 type:complete len:218 (-) Transcript_34482:629-1282(-)
MMDDGRILATNELIWLGERKSASNCAQKQRAANPPSRSHGTVWVQTVEVTEVTDPLGATILPRLDRLFQKHGSLAWALVKDKEETHLLLESIASTVIVDAINNRHFLLTADHPEDVASPDQNVRAAFSAMLERFRLRFNVTEDRTFLDENTWVGVLSALFSTRRQDGRRTARQNLHALQLRPNEVDQLRLVSFEAAESPSISLASVHWQQPHRHSGE